jgi:hypothetical protein
VKVTLVTCLVLGSLVAGAAACGGGNGNASGDGDKTFEGDGYSLTYPAEWEEYEPDEVPPEVVFTTVFAPPTGESALIFEISDGGSPVTADNIDEAEEDLAGAIQESTEGPIQLTMAGLPALRIVAHPRSDLTRRITTAFDGATIYIFDCAFTPDQAEEMQRGCDQVEESFQIE